MNPRRKLLCVGVALGFSPLIILAQNDARVRRIGYHSAGSSASNAGWLDAFRGGMAQLGWRDGRDYVIDARFADGRGDEVARVADELVATQPDLLLCPGDASTRALAKATKSIPIVFALAADPVEDGLAKSLQRPGGNATGLTTLSPDLAAKRLQLLKETFPAISNVIVLYEPAEPSGPAHFREIRAAASQLKLNVTGIELRRREDIDAAFGRAAAPGGSAYVIASGFLVAVERNAVAAGLVRLKAPAIATNPVLADAGVLMSYGPSPLQLFRQAAAYADKIFKGAKPADLPIEQPTKFELVINMRTAKMISAPIPGALLLRADRVIE
jgi:putative ABC transport system substrate-binding protein